MSYGKVKDTFWTDKKIKSFSDDAKLLSLYFMTGPHRNMLGCMLVPDGYILADLKWTATRLSNAIGMLSECHFICRDSDGWTLILNQLKHDPFRVPNHAKAAIALAAEVPTDSVVYQELVPRLKAALDVIGMASAWHPDEIAIPIPSPLPKPVPEPLPEGASASGGFVAPHWLPTEPWVSYEEMRKKKKAPMTNTARDLVLREVLSIKEKYGHDPGEVLWQSVRNSWTDVYPLKAKTDGTARKDSRQPSKTERAKAAVLRGAQSGGYASSGLGGEEGTSDDNVSVFPVLEALRQGTGGS